jgi:hypothetical protein
VACLALAISDRVSFPQPARKTSEDASKVLSMRKRGMTEGNGACEVLQAPGGNAARIKQEATKRGTCVEFSFLASYFNRLDLLWL